MNDATREELADKLAAQLGGANVEFVTRARRRSRSAFE